MAAVERLQMYTLVLSWYLVLFAEVRRCIPEIRLEYADGVIDHRAHTVRVAAGQCSTDAFLHDVKHVVHHAGAQLPRLGCIHGDGLNESCCRLWILTHKTKERVLFFTCVPYSQSLSCSTPPWGCSNQSAPAWCNWADNPSAIALNSADAL